MSFVQRRLNRPNNIQEQDENILEEFSIVFRITEKIKPQMSIKYRELFLENSEADESAKHFNL